MRKKLSVLKNRLLGSPERVDELTYWEQRTRQFGAKAVVDVRYSADEVAAVTERQVAEIFPHLRAVMPQETATVLDFGCGVGRFSGHLRGETGAEVVAADPTRGLLELAPAAEGVRYERVADGVIPVPSGSVDLLWICLVLGGIRAEKLPACVSELRRVLRPGAGVCLVENTADQPDTDRWFYRSAAFYEELLGFVPVERVHGYEDVGEQITVLTGRCS